MEPHLFRWGNRSWPPCPKPSETSLNGAPPIQMGKLGVGKSSVSRALAPQWSPTYSGGETAAEIAGLIASISPQWSPTYSGGETPSWGVTSYRLAPPQWSPTYSGGETRPTPNPSPPLPRLNGAPPIQVGKLEAATYDGDADLASMEPHLFRWGNRNLRLL